MDQGHSWDFDVGWDASFGKDFNICIARRREPIKRKKTLAREKETQKRDGHNRGPLDHSYYWGPHKLMEECNWLIKNQKANSLEKLSRCNVLMVF